MGTTVTIENGIVKCEIEQSPRATVLRYNGPNGGHTIEYAITSPEFIGFLYENGTVTTSPRLYDSSPDQYLSPLRLVTSIDRVRGGFDTIRLPTHILFREKT